MYVCHGIDFASMNNITVMCVVLSERSPEHIVD
jgi:hypothetical protein